MPDEWGASLKHADGLATDLDDRDGSSLETGRLVTSMVLLDPPAEGRDKEVRVDLAPELIQERAIGP